MMNLLKDTFSCLFIIWVGCLADIDILPCRQPTRARLLPTVIQIPLRLLGSLLMEYAEVFNCKLFLLVSCIGFSFYLPLNYILFQMMGSRICGYIFMLLLLGGVMCADEPTRITYISEYEVEQEDDFIEVTLEIDSESRSLVEALANAKRTAGEVAALANNYCKENAKKSKGDCKEAVEISQFEIEPQYQMVRKEATFSTFTVTHEVTIKVFHTESIGYLIDSFLKYPDLTLKGFQWLPLEEVNPEEAAIKAGGEQGEGLCNQVGLTLGKVISVEELLDQEEEAPAKDEEEEEQEEEEPEVIKYKFEVECEPKKGKK